MKTIAMNERDRRDIHLGGEGHSIESDLSDDDSFEEEDQSSATSLSTHARKEFVANLLISQVSQFLFVVPKRIDHA